MVDAKGVLQSLICLDEVYKRIRDDTATGKDRRFALELIANIRSYERQKGTDLSDLIELAKQGEFCPIFSEKLQT